MNKGAETKFIFCLSMYLKSATYQSKVIWVYMVK
jgi:hypothetical protein